MFCIETYLDTNRYADVGWIRWLSLNWQFVSIIFNDKSLGKKVYLGLAALFVIFLKAVEIKEEYIFCILVLPEDIIIFIIKYGQHIGK